jgi:hypothetical protein
MPCKIWSGSKFGRAIPYRAYAEMDGGGGVEGRPGVACGEANGVLEAIEASLHEGAPNFRLIRSSSSNSCV